MCLIPMNGALCSCHIIIDIISVCQSATLTAGPMPEASEISVGPVGRLNGQQQGLRLNYWCKVTRSRELFGSQKSIMYHLKAYTTSRLLVESI